MTRITATIRVTTIRSTGIHGGYIFAGQIAQTSDDARLLAGLLVVKAARAVIPNLVRIGEMWTVSGPIGRRSYVTPTGVPSVEIQMEAEEAYLTRVAGDNIVDVLANNPAFKGIGPVKARRLWTAHGEDLYRILDAGDVDALLSVLGPDVATTLVTQWAAYQEADLVRWLDQFGVPISIARKMAAFYGDDTRQKIEDNPYRLLSFDANWERVDALARASFGLALDDPRRLYGAVEESLYRHLRHNHTATTADQLKGGVATLIGSGVDRRYLPELISRAMDIGAVAHAFIRDGAYYHPTGIYLIEQQLAERFIRMAAASPRPSGARMANRAITAFSAAQGHALTGEQQNAVRLALTRTFSIIVGGAGVGKTTALRAVFEALTASGERIIPIALSGRATRRMSDATGYQAMTIASFIAHFDDETLDERCCVVVDEASMLDVLTAHNVLLRIPNGARPILVGDPAQLPPIGPGLVFHALVQEAVLDPVIAHLSIVHRQDHATGIPTVAAAIRSHEWPQFPRFRGPDDGISVLADDSPNVQHVSDVILDAYQALGGDSADVRILCPTRRAGVGTHVLNGLAQRRYRRTNTPVRYAGAGGQALLPAFFHRDRVMWTHNDYARGLMNGTLGRIWEVPGADAGHPCTVNFEGTQHSLSVEDLAHLELAYAITVHKSQGSQFERVIVPIYPTRLLDHSLIYTAITRGVRQVVLVGDVATAEAAVRAVAHAARRTIGFPRLLAARARDVGLR